MRELLYKNLTSVENRKKDIFMQEVYEKDGIVAKTERRCFYFIKNCAHLTDGANFKEWAEAQSDRSPCAQKRHFFIYKNHDDSHGADRLVCKIAGTFYAVTKNTVFTIGFLHSFKVSFLKAGMA